MFVSRSRHDRELAALERLLAVAEKRADDAKAEAEHATRLHELEFRRYGELLTLFHEATRYKPPTVTVPNGVVIEPRPKNIIAEKIRAEAGGDPRLMAHWQKFAQEQRALKKTDEEIAGLIGWTTGDPPEN